MAMYGYVRCSGKRQDVLAQIDALKHEGCNRIFKDKACSGATTKNRKIAAFERILAPGDVFVVAAIDRGFRNARDAIAFLDDV